MSTEWKSLLAFDNDGVEHTIKGKTFKFYPVSLRVLIELRDIATPLSKALAVLFSDNKSDYGTKELSGPADNGLGNDRQVIIEAIKPEVIELREKHKREAIETLVTAITAPATLGAIGKLIMDSLRELFPPGNKDNPAPIEFMGEIKADALYGFLFGVAKANKGMFGPLADQAGKAWAKVKEKMGNGLVSPAARPNPSNTSETPNKDGETSKTTSSSAPNAVTPSTGS